MWSGAIRGRGIPALGSSNKWTVAGYLLVMFDNPFDRGGRYISCQPMTRYTFCSEAIDQHMRAQMPRHIHIDLKARFVLRYIRFPKAHCGLQRFFRIALFRHVENIGNPGGYRVNSLSADLRSRPLPGKWVAAADLEGIV